MNQFSMHGGDKDSLTEKKLPEMGIPNLTTFVNKNYTWNSVRVQRPSKIVIDGYSLCHNLYYQCHTDWQLGGDYCEFYKTVSVYFEHLNSLEIYAYIVIDGIDYDKRKLDTTRTRCVQKLKVMAKTSKKKSDRVLPLFAKSVFVDALRDLEERDLGLKFYVANGEADQDVVSLANHFGCPVLGNDSDYFIFNIKGGYIPISDESGSVVDLGGKVKLFLYKDFDRQFSLRNHDLRLYLPVFLGNDFRLGIDSSMPIDEMLSMIGYIEESNHDVEILREVSLFYRKSSQSYDFLATSTFLCTKNPMAVIPQWVLDLYKCGKFMHALMYLLLDPIPKLWRYSVVVENISKLSAWKITQKMKLYIVGLLLSGQRSNCDLQVTKRYQCSLQDEVIPWSLKYDSVVDGTLADIPKLPESDRRDILLSIVNCKKVKNMLNSNNIPDDLKLVLVASRRWLKDIQQDHDPETLREFVNLLVCCILSCYAPPVGASYPLARERQLNTVHAFAQWQCVLHHVIALNQVLYLPYQYTSVAKLFSASRLHHYIQNPRKVWERMDELVELATDMVAIITRGTLISNSPAETSVSAGASALQVAEEPN